jgi:hypothetical protein
MAARLFLRGRAWGLRRAVALADAIARAGSCDNDTRKPDAKRIFVGFSDPALASRMYIFLIHECGPCRKENICRELNLKIFRG